MFVLKKTYNEMKESRNAMKKIAEETVTLNAKLISQNETDRELMYKVISELTDIIENNRLSQVVASKLEMISTSIQVVLDSEK
jgi:TRAP-type uncharacterized transport system substrate-binding protein